MQNTQAPNLRRYQTSQVVVSDIQMQQSCGGQNLFWNPACEIVCVQDEILQTQSAQPSRNEPRKTIAACIKQVQL